MNIIFSSSSISSYHSHLAMALRHHQSFKSSSRFLCTKHPILVALLLLSVSVLIFFVSFNKDDSLSRISQIPQILRNEIGVGFSGDLRDARIPWNKLCFGRSVSEKLKLAVFSKTWPVNAAPGGMERHAATLYHALSSRGHEIHVFTVPSDRKHHLDIHEANLHVYFAANDHGSVNTSLAFEIFNKVNADRGAPFDYIHTESVSLPHWRAKNAPRDVAVTWHGIWYEIMHSKLYQELLYNRGGPGQVMTELQEAMPRLVDEIRFFPSYAQHICISNSAGEALVKTYQLSPRNVHVILNGVDNTKFVNDQGAGRRFRSAHDIGSNVSLVLGVAGRLVRDKGHPLLYEAFSAITRAHPGVVLLVAGSGPWGKRYADLGPSVKVLGPLSASELSDFYNALDVFVNPTLRPQGLDLTIIEAMHCGKPVLAPNYPSIVGTAILSDDYGYTFSPNVDSFVEALERAIRDGREVMERKGMACKEFAMTMFTAEKMASAYERFFLCMKNERYCQYPLPIDNC